MNRTLPSFFGMIKLGAHQGPDFVPDTSSRTPMEHNRFTSSLSVPTWMCGIRIGRPQWKGLAFGFSSAEIESLGHVPSFPSKRLSLCLNNVS